MNIEAESFIKRQLMVEQQCFVTLYVLDAWDLASRDIGSESDPFIRVTCGTDTISTVDNYFEDENSPRFHNTFDFSAIFPGTSHINLEIVDYDDLFGNDVIGNTIIDLEDRFYSH